MCSISPSSLLRPTCLGLLFASRRSQQLSSTPVSSSCLAVGLGRRLPDYTLRNRDTLAYDIAIQIFLTIQALVISYTFTMYYNSTRTGQFIQGYSRLTWFPKSELLGTAGLKQDFLQVEYPSSHLTNGAKH